jgi:hypothetical protein
VPETASFLPLPSASVTARVTASGSKSGRKSYARSTVGVASHPRRAGLLPAAGRHRRPFPQGPSLRGGRVPGREPGSLRNPRTWHGSHLGSLPLPARAGEPDPTPGVVRCRFVPSDTWLASWFSATCLEALSPPCSSPVDFPFLFLYDRLLGRRRRPDFLFGSKPLNGVMLIRSQTQRRCRKSHAVAVGGGRLPQGAS